MCALQGMCNPKNYSDTPATSKSTVEELYRPIPSLFRALTEGEAPINMMVVSFPVAEELSYHENLVSFLETMEDQHQNVSLPGNSIHATYDTSQGKNHNEGLYNLPTLYSQAVSLFGIKVNMSLLNNDDCSTDGNTKSINSWTWNISWSNLQHKKAEANQECRRAYGYLGTSDKLMASISVLLLAEAVQPLLVLWQPDAALVFHVCALDCTLEQSSYTWADPNWLGDRCVFPSAIPCGLNLWPRSVSPAEHVCVYARVCVCAERGWGGGALINTPSSSEGRGLCSPYGIRSSMRCLSTGLPDALHCM